MLQILTGEAVQWASCENVIELRKIVHALSTTDTPAPPYSSEILLVVALKIAKSHLGPSKHVVCW